MSLYRQLALEVCPNQKVRFERAKENKLVMNDEILILDSFAYH